MAIDSPRGSPPAAGVDLPTAVTPGAVTGAAEGPGRTERLAHATRVLS